MKQIRRLPPVDWLQEQANEILDERDERRIAAALGEILDYYEPVNYHLAYGLGLWRARLCEDETGFGSLSKMHYPPVNYSKVGRANDSNSPLLYTSLTQLTALREVRVRPGDVVQVMAYKMDRRDPIRSFTLGEFASVHLGGRSNFPDAGRKQLNSILHKLKFEPGLSFVFMDAFLASVMIDKREQASGYVHSRVLARLIFQKYPSLEAIHYPSVAREGAVNVAIKPAAADRTLKFLGTSVLLVEKTFDFGLCRFRVLKSATKLADDSQFLWARADSSSLGAPGER